MNESILKEFFNRIEKDNVLDYPTNIKTDLLEVAKEELKELRIPFKSKTGKSNSLQLYTNTKTPLTYNKGFYPNNSNLGRIICKDKFLTQRFLDYAKIRTPKGRMFSPTELNRAKEFIFNNPDLAFVLKPVSLSMSLGTFLNVNIDNLENAWSESFNIQSKYKVKKPRVLIQEQITGLELRIIVVEGKIGTAVFRAPGNICGDGKSTIKELIEDKNLSRSEHNYLNRNPLKINDNLIVNLENKNLTLNSVLDHGEYCILYSQSSIATGREVFEVTKYLDENIFKQVLDAVTAIPGAHTAGVDIFVEDLDASQGTIIEVNLNPAFQLHYYPMTGTPSSPIYDVFESNNLDRKILLDDIQYEDLTAKEFELMKQRYKFLFNKEKSISRAYQLFLKQ